MRTVFRQVEIIPVNYHTQHVDESFTDWLFLGKLAPWLAVVLHSRLRLKPSCRNSPDSIRYDENKLHLYL